MKRSIIVIIAVCYSFFCANMLFAADTWTQKADFGGTARDRAVGFSIGTKGYMGTGWGDVSDKKDFWEYDPAADTWTQKADFGGTRYGAVGFSIGSKGYIGTGGTGTSGSSFTKDFWEYNPAANTWTQKADFGGPTRFAAVGFSIGSKGYIGTGWSKDFWEYDPAANTWTQKADFGGTARNSAAGFSIGSKGYIGTGTDGSLTKDFWEYDPAANTWTRKADFGGTARWTAVGFSIGSKGYIGTGDGGSFNLPYKDFWEYDPAANTWTQKADFGGTARFMAKGFSIGNKGYIGTGEAVLNLYTKDFWEYDPAASTCTYSISPTLTSFGTSIARTGTVAVTSSSSSCSWIATSNDAWITVTSGSSGSGNGTVGWSIPENSGPARTGTITIAGKTYTIMQGAATYLLTASYTGWGMVTSSPAGISCGSDCTENYTSGTPVTLTAIPVSGWTFTGWSGGGCAGTSTICQVTMDSSKLVTANFADGTGPTGSASITFRDNTYLYLNLSFDDPSGITMMRFMFVYRGGPGGTTPMSSSFDNSPRGVAPMSSSCEGGIWQGFVPYSPTTTVLAPEEYGSTDVCAQVQDGLGNLSAPTLAGQVWNGKVSGYIRPPIASVPFVSNGKVNQANGMFTIFVTLPPNGRINIPSHRPGDFNLTVRSTPGYKETTKAFSLPNNGNADVGYIDLIPDDITAPTVTGATSTTADGFYKAGAAVNITVNFSEPVTSAGLTINLNSGATITTGALTSQSSWSGTYTVAAGQTSGDLTISAITGTITDAAANSSTNPAIPTGQNIADTRAIVIDTTAPTAVSAGANQTKNAPFTQTGTASDTNPMTYQWAMQSGPGAITCGTPTASSTTISATVGGTYIIRFTATDAAGNSTSSDMTLIWDASAPTVTGATSTTADGFYKAGGAVNVTVTFSEAVTSAGLTITLNSGAVITTGALNSQSIWSGTYTVAAGQTSGDLTISSITGTITNAAANSTTNPAIPAGQNIADTKAIVIDTTAPVTTATPAGGSFGSAQNVILSANEQATIYYTTNGSDPTASSSVYGTAIPIAATATLKFFAKDQTGNVEAIKSQTYTIYLNGIPGDLDGDGAVTLADAIIALQAMVGMQVPKSGADINGDGKVGLPELLYILQQAAGVRQ